MPERPLSARGCPAQAGAAGGTPTPHHAESTAPAALVTGTGDRLACRPERPPLPSGRETAPRLGRLRDSSAALGPQEPIGGERAFPPCTASACSPGDVRLRAAGGPEGRGVAGLVRPVGRRGSPRGGGCGRSSARGTGLRAPSAARAAGEPSGNKDVWRREEDGLLCVAGVGRESRRGPGAG